MTQILQLFHRWITTTYVKSHQIEVPIDVPLVNIKQQVPLKSNIATDMVG